MQGAPRTPAARNRMTGERAAHLYAVSVLVDVIKAGLLFIPFVGIFINWFIIVPLTTIGFIHYQYAHWDIGPGGRGGLQRLILRFILGPIPLTTTLAAAFDIWHARREDKRYNEEQGTI